MSQPLVASRSWDEARDIGHGQGKEGVDIDYP